MKKIVLIIVLSLCSISAGVAVEDVEQPEKVADSVIILSPKTHKRVVKKVSKTSKQDKLRANLSEYPQYYSTNVIEEMINNIPWKYISDFSESFYIMLENGDLNYLRGNYNIFYYAHNESMMSAIQKIIIAMKCAKYTDKEIYTYIEYSDFETLSRIDDFSKLIVPSVYTAIEKGYMVAMVKNTNNIYGLSSYYVDEEKMSQLIADIDKLTSAGLSADESCKIIFKLLKDDNSKNYSKSIICIIDVMLANGYTCDEIMQWLNTLKVYDDVEIISPIYLTFIENKIPFNTLFEHKLKLWYEIYKISPKIYMKLLEQGVAEPTEEMVKYLSDKNNCDKLLSILEKQKFNSRVIEAVLASKSVKSSKKIPVMKSIQRYEDYEENPNYLFDDVALEKFYMGIAFTFPLTWPALPFGLSYNLCSRSRHAAGRIFYIRGIKNKEKFGIFQPFNLESIREIPTVKIDENHFKISKDYIDKIPHIFKSVANKELALDIRKQVEKSVAEVTKCKYTSLLEINIIEDICFEGTSWNDANGSWIEYWTITTFTNEYEVPVKFEYKNGVMTGHYNIKEMKQIR